MREYSPSIAMVTTDEQGGFVLDGCANGGYSLRVEWRGREQDFPLESTGPPESPLVLAMPATGVLRGTVRAADSLRLVVSMGHAESELEAEVESGGFVIQDIPVGEYDLRVVSRKPGGARASVSRKVTIDAGDSNRVALEFPQGTARIDGQCWMDGVRVGFVELVLACSGDGSAGPTSIRVSSDEAGRYAVEEVPCGHAILTAKTWSSGRGRTARCVAFAELDVAEGGHLSQDLWFRTDGKIVGEVPGVQPDEYLRVNLMPDVRTPQTNAPEAVSGPTWLDCFFASTGESQFRFSGVAPGRYMIVAETIPKDGAGGARREMTGYVTVSATDRSPCSVTIQ